MPHPSSPRPGGSGGASDEDVPACEDCGACCFADRPLYVRVHGADYARLGDEAERVTIWDENRAFLRMTDGHCAALGVDAVSGRFGCTIYASRPTVCRELERGGGPCRDDREQKGARALVVLRRG